MLIGMHSYTYRRYPLERALAKARKYGYDFVELQPVHFDIKNVETELERVKDLSQHFNMPIHVVDFSSNVLVDDDQRRRESIELVKRVVCAASKFGAKVINGGVGSLIGPDSRNYGANGSAMAEEHHYEMAAEAFSEIGKVAEDEGIIVTFEIHMNTLHDTATSTLKLIEMIGSPAIKANPDPGNMYATPHAEDSVTALKLLAGNVGYFHFKNCRSIGGKYDYSWDLQSGDIDFFPIILQMSQVGFPEFATIEYCGLGDPSVAAERDILYIQTLLDEVEELSGK
jgi:3-dehydroshikimate dehydratase